MTNDEREQRLHAILHEYLQARDRGEAPDRQKILDAHPDLRDDLAAYFADASRLDQLARSLHTAPFHGDAATSAKPFVAPKVEDLQDAFANLEILELLGQGGMGAVYKARHKGLDRLVAVKILPGASGPAFAERFTREARALARLSHPHIVGVHDFGQTTSGLFYFVMEYIDGVTLRQALRTGLTPEQALAIVPQICDALQFAHDEGIVHRDIKPENVLLDRKGRVKIADFGLAKLLGTGTTDAPLTGTHQVMGTLRYMAPEQMEGSKEVDHRADIYSLGVVFYELLTGELPMGRFAPPSKKVHIDVRLDEVVLRALEKEPEQRWQQASAVKTEVEAIQANKATPVAEPYATPKSPPKKTSFLGRMALASLLVAMLVPVFLHGANISAYAVGQSLRIGLIVPMALGLLSIRYAAGRYALIGAVVVLGTFSAVQIFTQKTADPIRSPLFGDTGFVAGPNGPMVGPAVEAKLGIPTHQLAEANGIFQRYYNGYTALERRHTKHTRDEAGHVHVTIEPFVDEMHMLMKRLHAEIGGIVDENRVPPLPARGKVHNSFGLFRQAGEGKVQVELWKDASGQYNFKGRVTWLDGGEGEVSYAGPTIDAIPKEYRLYWSE